MHAFLSAAYVHIVSFIFFLFLFDACVCLASPSRNPTSPVIVQQQPVQNTTMTPKWPLKPGVLVHANGARFTQGLAMSLSSLPKANAAGGTPVGSQTTGSGKSRAEGRKIWNLQRRRAVSLGSLALPDDTSQRSRVIRIRKMFSPERPDSLPNGVSHGKSGGNSCQNGYTLAHI